MFKSNLTFAVSVEGKEYACILERTFVGCRDSKYKCAGSNGFSGSGFSVTMSFIDKSERIVYQQVFCGSDATSLLNKKLVLLAATLQELESIPFDIRFVKRMAKRAMATRLESLRLDGKRKAAYGWSISNGRKRTSVTSR